MKAIEAGSIILFSQGLDVKKGENVSLRTHNFSHEC